MKFENLLKQNDTMHLFEILAIVSYDFRPSFWQFMDSVPKELFIF